MGLGAWATCTYEGKVRSGTEDKVIKLENMRPHLNVNIF